MTPVNFKAMPGIEGDVWLAGGAQGSDYGLYHSTDSGATFTKLSNVDQADVVGFGKAAPGQNYMALYISAQVNGVRGIFRSNDTGATWVRINDDAHQYGRTNMCITGDPRTYGRVYVGTNGRGIVYGDSTVTPPVVTSSIITPTTATFDKNTAKQSDVAVTMTLNGNTLSSIANGTTALVSGTDYSTSGSSVTINKAYLAKQAVGTTNLTFAFSAGLASTLAVAVSDSTVTPPVTSSAITPTTATFDKNTAKQADAAVTMTLNGNTLSSISNGTTALVSGTDYSTSGNTVTISKAYLAKQAVGTTNLTFAFSAGSAATLAITVGDTTVVSTGSVQVQMYNKIITDSSNSISPQLKIVNTGSTAINLANLKVRYYLTSDGATSQSFWCDWANIGTTNVSGNFVTMATPKDTANCYLEISFSSTAGNLAAGDSVLLQTRFSKSDWSNYTQSNDYSYNATATTYTAWNKVTAYISDALQYGIEP